VVRRHRDPHADAPFTSFELRLYQDSAKDAAADSGSGGHTGRKRRQSGSTTVIHTVLYGYLAGWIVTSIALALAGRTFYSQAWGSHPVPVAVAAGAIWPLVMVGAAQMATVAIVAEVTRRWATREASISDREIDELVDKLLVGAGTQCESLAHSTLG
jgi:hypothetical protein